MEKTQPKGGEIEKGAGREAGKKQMSDVRDQ